MKRAATSRYVASYRRWQHANSANHVHGLIVMRRSAVEAALAETTDLNNFADWLLTLMVAKRGGVLHLPSSGGIGGNTRSKATALAIRKPFGASGKPHPSGDKHVIDRSERTHLRLDAGRKRLGHRHGRQLEALGRNRGACPSKTAT